MYLEIGIGANDRPVLTTRPNRHGERIQYGEFTVRFVTSFSIDEHELIVRKFELCDTTGVF